MSNRPVLHDGEEPIDDDAIRPNLLVYRTAAGRAVPVPYEVVRENDVIFLAHERSLNGHSWSKIAADLDFPNAQAAKAAVQNLLAEARFLHRQDTARVMLENELDYLDMLKRNLANGVAVGDVQAIRTALAVATKKVEWLDLAVETDKQIEHVTVVQAGDDYVAYMQRQVAAQEGPQTVPSTVSTSPEEDS